MVEYLENIKIPKENNSNNNNNKIKWKQMNDDDNNNYDNDDDHDDAITAIMTIYNNNIQWNKKSSVQKYVPEIDK